MHMLVDMASSPQYLAPSAQNPDHLDIDPRITGLPDGSCPGIAPSTIAYSTSEQTSYSEVSHLSPFDTSPILDDHLLTPVSSAASPQLQQRSCKPSPFAQHRELTPCPQQPTPPNSTVMYSSYSDYGTSSMPMQTTVAESPHELLSSYQHHYGSPSQQQHHHHHHHHEDPQGQQPTPPQPQPYYGAFGVSADQAPPEHYYLPPSTIDNPLGLLRADVSGGSYTHHRVLAPLAPLTPTAAPMATLLHPTAAAAPPSLSSPHYRRDMAMPLPRLTPSSHHHRRQSSLSLRRDPARKAKARRNNNSNNKNNTDSSSRRNSFSPPPQTPQQEQQQQQQQQATTGQQFCYGEGAMATEDGGPDSGEVTLDDKTPADLRRLWETRLKYIGKKGNGMWDDIMMEYYGKDFLSENKKTQVKAALQMKIHRMLLKHGQWPAKDEAALLRAYRRWEESRYIEILRLYEEEIAGERKGYEWKSQHVEAQLVKMGLEEPERDRDSKARKRKQVSARHSQSRGAAASSSAAAYRQSSHHRLQQQQQRSNNVAAARLPGMFDAYHHYGAVPPLTAPQQQSPHVHHAPYDPRFEVASLVEQLGAQPPALSEEQQERLIDEVIERDGDETSSHNHPTLDDSSNSNSGDNNNNNSSSSSSSNNSIPSHPNHPSILHITTAFDDEPHSNASSSSSSRDTNNNHHTHTTDDDDEMEAIAVRSLQQEPNYSHHPQGHSAHSHHRHSHSLSSDVSRPRSAAARGVCGGEMMISSPQHFGQGVGA